VAKDLELGDPTRSGALWDMKPRSRRDPVKRDGYFSGGEGQKAKGEAGSVIGMRASSREEQGGGGGGGGGLPKEMARVGEENQYGNTDTVQGALLRPSRVLLVKGGCEPTGSGGRLKHTMDWSGYGDWDGVGYDNSGDMG